MKSFRPSDAGLSAHGFIACRVLVILVPAVFHYRSKGIVVENRNFRFAGLKRGGQDVDGGEKSKFNLDEGKFHFMIAATSGISKQREGNHCVRKRYMLEFSGLMGFLP